MRILDTIIKIFASERLNKEIAEELNEEDPEDADEKVRAWCEGEKAIKDDK